jgi:hypothetical protein
MVMSGRDFRGPPTPEHRRLRVSIVRRHFSPYILKVLPNILPSTLLRLYLGTYNCVEILQ